MSVVYRATFAACIALTAALAHAQSTYPAKPVRLIAPFPAAGPLDAAARLYAQKLGERWGQSVIVENRIGATGTIGTESVVRAAPDGYTLLFTVDLPIVMAPNLMKAPYDPRKDLLPVAAFGSTMNMLVAHPSLNVKTLAELVAAAKANPGKITFSSAGPASPGHLCGEMLKTAAGIDMTHVPYKGAAPAMVAAVSGEVGIFCGPLGQGMPQVRAGKVVALGVTGKTRSVHAPDVAPIADAYPSVETTNWYAVFAPVGTPAAVLQVVSTGLRAVYDDPEIAKRVAQLGFDPLWMTPAEITKVIEADLAKWGKVVREANVKP